MKTTRVWHTGRWVEKLSAWRGYLLQRAPSLLRRVVRQRLRCSLFFAHRVVNTRVCFVCFCVRSNGVIINIRSEIYGKDVPFQIVVSTPARGGKRFLSRCLRERKWPHQFNAVSKSGGCGIDEIIIIFSLKKRDFKRASYKVTGIALGPLTLVSCVDSCRFVSNPKRPLASQTALGYLDYQALGYLDYHRAKSSSSPCVCCCCFDL